MEAIALVMMSPMLPPTRFDPMNSRMDTPTTMRVAKAGVRQRGWSVPKIFGMVLSRPIENSVRVTWISVVSSVAIVDSATAITRILPPMPGHTASPSTERTFALLCSIVLAGRITIVAMVKISNSRKTMTTPMMPADPAFLWPSLVSSLRLDETSQPQ